LKRLLKRNALQMIDECRPGWPPGSPSRR